MDLRQQKAFPYDVPFHSRKTVGELLDLSKQFYFSEIAYLLLTHDETFPKAKLPALTPLKGLRFFEDELLFELQTRLGPVDFPLYRAKILNICSHFSKFKQPLWTPERAQAHLQTADALLRRASVSDSLWVLWKEKERAGVRMTEQQMRRHLASENLGINLTPPMWVKHISIAKGTSAEVIWAEMLKKQGYDIHSLRQEHVRLMREKG